MPMDISKTKNNYDKEGRFKCFNCNKYKHMAKKYQKKKEKGLRKYFRCKKVGHITKYCKKKQQMKTRSIKNESENKDKEEGFDEDPE